MIKRWPELSHYEESMEVLYDHNLEITVDAKKVYAF